MRNQQETQENTQNQDKDLEAIRYYHGNFENFFNYWKKRGVESDPYKGTEIIHPKREVQKESTLPYQDFGTYDRAKKNRLCESYQQFLDEENEEN